MLNKDHPRRCGENRCSHSPNKYRTGSPPQVRGKQLPLIWNCFKHRITPAGAGKTYERNIIFELFQDHPRRCGENLFQRYLFRFPLGSPPQVRGKPFVKSILTESVRITPAGAGKTGIAVVGGVTEEDHPRRCGENALYQ